MFPFNMSDYEAPPALLVAFILALICMRCWYEHYRARLKTHPAEFEILQPFDNDAFMERLSIEGTLNIRTTHTHWTSTGVHRFDRFRPRRLNAVPNETARRIAKSLIDDLPNITDWLESEKTDEYFNDSGFRAFERTLDMAPKENHKFEGHLMIIYESMARYFKSRGYQHSELSWDEVESKLMLRENTGFLNVSRCELNDFLARSDWHQLVDEVRESLRNDISNDCVFRTMVRKEKKRVLFGYPDFKLISYLPLPVRILELKLFGRLFELTKPQYCHFGIGGLALHDVGMRLKEVWKGKGVNSHIADFDAKISVFILSLENYFIKMLGGNIDCESMYRVYAYPRILIPGSKSWTDNHYHLLMGRGQRMNGTNVVHSMGTITRLAIAILQMALGGNEECHGETLAQFTLDALEGKSGYAGVIFNGEDCITAEDELIEKYSKTGYILDELGMPREYVPTLLPKNTPKNVVSFEFSHNPYQKVTLCDEDTDRTVEIYQSLVSKSEFSGITVITKENVKTDTDSVSKYIPAYLPSIIIHTVEDVEFINHRYEIVMYYDFVAEEVVTKYQAIRDVTDIVAEILVWSGCEIAGMSEVDWLCQKGMKLLVNYPHMKTVRILALACCLLPEKTKPMNHIISWGELDSPQRLQLVWKFLHSIIFGREPQLDLFAPPSQLVEVDFNYLLAMCNDALFGSTAYKVETDNFKFWKFEHIEFLNSRSESMYDKHCLQKKREHWRSRLLIQLQMHSSNLPIFNNDEESLKKLRNKRNSI